MIIAERYAEAFLAHAKETIGFEKGLEELGGVGRVVKDNPDLQNFLESKEISADEKHMVIDKVFQRDFTAETIHLIKLLIDKDRINHLLDIAEYARITYAHGAAISAVLKTSYPLDTSVIDKLKKALEHRFDRKIHMFIELDPDLLGGVSVKVGNIIIDGTVKSRFEDLRETLRLLKVA